jgi:hypothetical protein
MEFSAAEKRKTLLAQQKDVGTKQKNQAGSLSTEIKFSYDADAKKAHLVRNDACLCGKECHFQNNAHEDCQASHGGEGCYNCTLLGHTANVHLLIFKYQKD